MNDWRARANCIDVPKAVFYPGDLNRTGPITEAIRENAVLAVVAGVDLADVAEQYGVTVRLVRYWITMDGRRANTRRTTVRPGVEAARVICAGCEVRTQCLEAALAADEQHGIWGGLTPEERRAEVRRRNRGVA